MVEDVVTEARQNMEKAIESLVTEMARVRTGRASVALLDSVKVDYYGSKSPLSQVATLSTPDARMILVKPWDKALLPIIEKAIHARGDLGLSPNSDGEVIRLPVPALTQERRADLAKQIKKMGEDGRVAVRNHRRDANETLKELQKSGDISEDDQKVGLKKVQEVTDKFVADVDTLIAEKEKEILEG